MVKKMAKKSEIGDDLHLDNDSPFLTAQHLVKFAERFDVVKNALVSQKNRIELLETQLLEEKEDLISVFEKIKSIDGSNNDIKKIFEKYHKQLLKTDKKREREIMALKESQNAIAEQLHFALDERSNRVKGFS